MHSTADHPSLEPGALLAGYLRGWFPMDEEGATGPVGFYEADPRAVLPVGALRVPRSVARGVRREGYDIRVDAAFDAVVAACAEDRDGMWLTPRLARAYGRLHRAGHAHSVEAWRDGELAGGLFGVALGGLYTSESMFHRAPDAGNAALVGAALLLVEMGAVLWDIQMSSPHTRRFGAREVGAEEYRALLAEALARPPLNWSAAAARG
ncbi:MAG: leucyl/phenylalanyl-tRNA--protein transferase [Thermoleophilia bacterium]